MVLICPKCGSFVLTRYGTPSRLDGERHYLCLSCGADLHPRRLRGLLSLALALSLLIGIGLGAYAIDRAAQNFDVMTLRALVGTGVCALAAGLTWRAMWAPVPKIMGMSTFPSPFLRLTELKIRTEGEIEPHPDWVEPFSNYLDDVIDAVGKCLEERGGRYTVSVGTVCTGGIREHTVGYQGTPDEEGLEKLFTMIETMPVFVIPAGTVKLELCFRVG